MLPGSLLLAAGSRLARRCLVAGVHLVRGWLEAGTPVRFCVASKFLVVAGSCFSAKFVNGWFVSGSRLNGLWLVRRGFVVLSSLSAALHGWLAAGPWLRRRAHFCFLAALCFAPDFYLTHGYFICGSTSVPARLLSSSWVSRNWFAGIAPAHSCCSLSLLSWVCGWHMVHGGFAR